MPPEDSKPIPRATYRLQLNKDFGFARAAALAPYLSRLGVSHVYCSPYLRARPGSMHGYDIVSYCELNPELGDAGAFDRMVAAFQTNGLGQVLDFVPNHMGVGGADNLWWLDVLELGPDSTFASWFDIDWESDRSYLQGKLLVPFLGEQYGSVLQSGALRLKFDADAGSFAVWAYDIHKLPISPLHYKRILGEAHPVLERLGDAFAHLLNWRPYVARHARELKGKLVEAAKDVDQVAAAIQAGVDRFHGETGDLHSWSRLHALINDQHWRAAHFRVAADDINYRRFFNINDLAGVRMELPELFDHAHSLVFQLLDKGVLDGIRLDHVDGLFDPKGYCQRLREKAPRSFYLVVEKILAQHESLREDWNVDGTTGYEFANLVAGLLNDPAGEEPLTRFYAEFTGSQEAFADIVRDSKIYIMENDMASELNALARDAARVARSNLRTADFTDNLLQRALKEIIAGFPVYRTYVDGRSAPTDADRRDIDWAVAQARVHGAGLDPSVFDFLHALLTCDLVAQPRNGFSRAEVVRVAMRAQQYTGPVMAKGLEDTAFYRYNRMLALNEVGGHPDQFGVSVPAFHDANALRAKRTPHALLSTATHDTKRGEDTRARLAVISEIPAEWAQQVTSWSQMLRARSAGLADEPPPDRNDEYVFYQLLLGAWPAELSTGQLDSASVHAFQPRIEGAMIKAMREAKVHSTWAAPNAVYEEAVINFIRYSLDTSHCNAFLESFASFQCRVAALGVRNSLVQTVMKLTVPGVPDIYQGAELWDFSMVDPDNRRPVDYKARRSLLEVEKAHRGDLGYLLENWRDGRIKLRIIADLLALRRREPNLFSSGSYEPLGGFGPQMDRICAFMRSAGESAIVVAALLFPSKTHPADDWNESAVQLPAGADARRWKDLFSCREIGVDAGLITARELFSVLPVAILVPAD